MIQAGVFSAREGLRQSQGAARRFMILARRL